MTAAEPTTNRSELHRELRRIADYLARLHGELGALQPAELHRVHLPTAGKELAGIVKTTEAATEGILEHAEAVLSAEIRDLDAYKAFVNLRMLSMMEACAFQDVTGQRIARICQSLEQIGQRLARFAAAVQPADGSEPQATEHRPEAKVQRLSQRKIDRLFR